MEDAAKVEPAEAKAGYGLHSKILSEMRGALKDGAELGYTFGKHSQARFG